MPTIPARVSTTNQKRGPVVQTESHYVITQLKYTFLQIYTRWHKNSTALINHVTSSFYRIKFVLQAIIMTPINL